MSDDDERMRDMGDRERVRAAIHFASGELCRALALSLDVDFSDAAVAAIAEVSNRKMERLAKDSAAFARHAKRMTIQSEDILLNARKNPSLKEHLSKFIDEEEVERAEKRKKRKRAPEEDL